MTHLRLHQFVSSSLANGPGERSVVWLQGCALKCPGCFNPLTHDQESALEVNPLDLASKINALSVRGVTITGGEPLQQPKAVEAFISALSSTKDVLLYSGFSLLEVMCSTSMRRVLKRVDAALLGRFSETAVHPFDAKQLVLRTGRIREFEFEPTRHVEINVNKITAVVTGFPWRTKDF